MERIAAAEAAEPVSAEGWKQRGGEAYARKDWQEAARCYSAALRHCGPDDEMATTCLNNRAACHAQLQDHGRVVEDATEVLARQPANAKALLRRMVALDALGRSEEALEDAGCVLTMEPKNPHALEVVAKKRKGLAKRPAEGLPRFATAQVLCVFLFTEDRPLQCYACLRSLRKHVGGVALHVYVFWQAREPACARSYQLLQCLPETSRFPRGSVDWVDASGGGLFGAFARTANRLSVEGHRHVLLLSDTVLFHSDVDASVALRALDERREVFTARLDLSPRIEHFSEAQLMDTAPHLQSFAGHAQVLLWTRSYDKSKKAYEAVPREVGWDAILDWTATIIRVEHVQHFFSALLPPLETVGDLDEKAADWLSRRQRMKRSEISQRSACYDVPLVVTMDPAAFGDPTVADRALRRHLFTAHGLDGSAGDDRPGKFAAQLGWKLHELMDYFKGVDAENTVGQSLQGLLEPERYRQHYWSSVRVPTVPPTCGLPRALNPPSPLVSWLVPARNAEHFLPACFASMRAQEGLGAGCFEVVLVNDASEDETLAVLRRLAAECPFVRVVDSAAQLGVAGALAEGWRQCRGDFVARLDADDEAEPDRLVKQLRYMEQHRSVSVLGGRTRPFWTEQRKCTVERVSEKADGRVAAAAWREFHGNQTSRQREQLTFQARGAEVVVADGPAEYDGCRLLRVGAESLMLRPDGWKAALRAVQGGTGEVLLERRDPLEPPCGSRALHPLLVRASLLFENCVAGTTALLRRGHFPAADGGCPFRREAAAECHWAWLSLGGQQHAANLADPLVRARRYAGNRAERDASGMQESQRAAVLHHLKHAFEIDADLEDAAALLNWRGPRTPEQGEKILEMLQQVSTALIAQYVRPPAAAGGGDDFWRDFVQGRETALERALFALRQRFQALADEVSRVITNGEKSPREHRSRTPPR